MANITLTVDIDTLNKMREFYKENIVPNNGEYVEFFARLDDSVVTAYKPKKDKAKVVFNSVDEARIWDNSVQEVKEVKKTTTPTKACWIDLDEQIGSDEVGTGDFFGPVVVCSTFTSKEDIKFLKELGVDDSKRINDDKILELGKVLMERLDYALVVLENDKYNSVNVKGFNMNSIKARLHNRAIFTLNTRHQNVNIYLDEFASKDNYYGYLKGVKDIAYGIHFKTKGESYYPSIAAGSIIARYNFLLKIKELNEKYDVDIPLGGSNKVTEFATTFVEKYGLEELDKNVKKNFKNYQEVISNKK